MALVAPIIGAVSDLLLAHPDWWERDASAWLEVCDRLDLVELFAAVGRGRSAVPPRHAIAAILREELARRFDPERPHYRRDVPDPRPPKGEKPLERRLALSAEMVEILRQSVPLDGGGFTLPDWTPRMTRTALARRGLVVDPDSIHLTAEGCAAARHFQPVDPDDPR